MRNVLKVVYFGGSVAYYVNDELFAYDNGEDTHEILLELVTKKITRVVRYGISEESSFWDNIKIFRNWYPSRNIKDFEHFCTEG